VAPDPPQQKSPRSLGRCGPLVAEGANGGRSSTWPEMVLLFPPGTGRSGIRRSGALNIPLAIGGALAAPLADPAPRRSNHLSSPGLFRPIGIRRR